MTRDQKTVAIGAASGIVTMILLVWLLASVIPAPAIDGTADRIAYALRWIALPALLLLIMLAAVGNARFLTEAIDPTLGKEDLSTIINGRVADNSTQQFLLFLTGSLALSVTLPPERLNIVPAAVITFIVARVAFWIGYRIHPLYRAPGFASTAYMNLFMLAGAAWLAFR